MLVPLATLLQAQCGAQARTRWLDHRADPPAVLAVPLGGVLLAVVPAVGAGVDRSLAAHSYPGSLPSGWRALASSSDRQPSAGLLLVGHWQASGGRMPRPQRACFACQQASRRPHGQWRWRCGTASRGITRAA